MIHFLPAAVNRAKKKKKGKKSSVSTIIEWSFCRKVSTQQATLSINVKILEEMQYSFLLSQFEELIGSGLGGTEA